MDEKFEQKLKTRAKAILEKGRGDDWQHTLRAVGYARHLLRFEPGDEDIVIPSLYLHDIGWSRVDYSDFQNAPPAAKQDVKSVRLHMQYGSEMAAEILAEMGYDPEKTGVIAAIVAVHDDVKNFFAMEDPSAVIVAEADRLDRYGPASLERYKKMFGVKSLAGKAMDEARQLRITGLREWFKTPTAVALAEKLGRESGWFI